MQPPVSNAGCDRMRMPHASNSTNSSNSSFFMHPCTHMQKVADSNFRVNKPPACIVIRSKRPLPRRTACVTTRGAPGANNSRRLVAIDWSHRATARPHAQTENSADVVESTPLDASPTAAPRVLALCSTLARQAPKRGEPRRIRSGARSRAMVDRKRFLALNPEAPRQELEAPWHALFGTAPITP